MINKLCEKFGFKQHNSFLYNAQKNDLAKAFNKILEDLLNQVVAKSKRDWHERIRKAFWVYRTIHRTPTQATPYSSIIQITTTFEF